MMTRRMRMVGCLLAMGLMMTGCMPQNFSEDLEKQVKEEYEQKGQEWFASNMSDAQVNSLSLYHSRSDLYNLVSGEMEYEGNTYEYLLNSDDGMLYTEAGYSLAKEHAKELILQKINYPVEKIEIGSFAYYSVSCTEIRNMTSGMNQQETDVSYTEVTLGEPYLPWDYSEDQIEQWTSDQLSKKPSQTSLETSVYIYLKDYSVCTNGTDLYQLITDYPGIELVYFYVEGETEKEYYCLYADHKNSITHHYKDSNGDWKYERE